MALSSKQTRFMTALEDHKNKYKASTGFDFPDNHNIEQLIKDKDFGTVKDLFDNSLNQSYSKDWYSDYSSGGDTSGYVGGGTNATTPIPENAVPVENPTDNGTEDGTQDAIEERGDPGSIENAITDLTGLLGGEGEYSNATEFSDYFQDKYSVDFQQVGTGTSGEMQSYLDLLQGRSTGYTAEEQSALDAQKSLLGGYSSPEVQAMREQSMDAINRDYLTNLRGLQSTQRQSFTRGGAAAAQAANLGVGKTQTVGNLERDLIVQNAQEAAGRTQAYGGFVRELEDALTNRQSLYGGALGAEEGIQRNLEQYNAQLADNEEIFNNQLGISGLGTFTGLASGQQGVDLAQTSLQATIDNANRQQDFYSTQYEGNLGMQQQYLDLMQKAYKNL